MPGEDGVGRLIGADRDQDAAFGVVGDERAGHLRVHPEPVPDHVGGVVGAPALARAVQQPPREHRLGRVQVDRRVQLHAEPGREVRGGDGLRQRAREAVQDVAARGRRLDHDRGQHVQHDPVGNQVAAGLTGRDLAAERAAGPGFGAQHVTGRDVPRAGPGREAFTLRSLPGAGRSEQQQSHPTVRPSGGTISRFWILPVGPLGSTSTIHRWRGYLYAATWPFT